MYMRLRRDQRHRAGGHAAADGLQACIYIYMYIHIYIYTHTFIQHVCVYVCIYT